MWLTICTGIVGYVPEGKFKRWLNYHVSIMCFGVLSSALSAVITYHNPENRPKCGICVANHTSPIDVLVLACDNCYALVGCGVDTILCCTDIPTLVHLTFFDKHMKMKKKQSHYLPRRHLGGRGCTTATHFQPLH
jgi:hypothetical protein